MIYCGCLFKCRRRRASQTQSLRERNMVIELILLLFLILLVTFSYLSNQWKGIPPGPRGWPIVGVLPSGGKTMLEQIYILKEKYGDIFSLYVGSRLYVVLTDYKLIKAAFSRPELSGRPHFYSLRLLNFFENAGISFAEGPIWTTNRRFAVRHLREMGLGKSELESVVQHEVSALVDNLKDRVGKPVEMDYIINVAVVNIIWSLVGGEREQRSEITDTEKQDYTRMKAENIMYLDGPISWLDKIPWLVPFVPRIIKEKWMNVDKMIYNRDTSISYFKKCIKAHQDTLDKKNPRDLIDHYLIEMENQKNSPDNLFREDLMDLILTIDDLFAAGSDTTASTIRWTVLHMAARPEIQARVQKEIDENIPGDRMPCLEDRPNLPYTAAMIQDLQRLITLFPVALPHRAVAEVELNGYKIPEGSVVLPFLEGCHKDSKYWERPNELYPEHFLDEEGHLVTKKEGFLPFDVGRRSCPGEAMANIELFLFITAILKTFTISAPPGLSLSAEPKKDRFLLNPAPPFEVVLTLRKNE